MSRFGVTIKHDRRLFGEGLARALIAVFFAVVAAESAAAATPCDCPACPAHACVQMGCPVGDDGDGCATASDVACADGIALPFAARTGGIVTPHFAAPVAFAGMSGGGAPWDRVARRELALPPASPAHLVFCRLWR